MEAINRASHPLTNCFVKQIQVIWSINELKLAIDPILDLLIQVRLSLEGI